MLQILHKDKFSEMLFDEQKGIFYHHVFPETDRMEEEEYKTMISTWRDAVLEKKARLVLVNALNFLFPMTPELQEWSTNMAKEANQDRTAFVMPQEFIAGLAIEQFIDEANAVDSQTSYFATIEEAEKWLLS